MSFHNSRATSAARTSRARPHTIAGPRARSPRHRCTANPRISWISSFSLACGLSKNAAKERCRARGRRGRGWADSFRTEMLNTAPMRKFDAHMKLGVKKLRAAALRVESLQLTADLVDGLLQVSELDVGAAGGHVAGSFEFDAREELPVARVSLDGRNLRLERVMSPRPAEAASEGGVRALLRANGRGKSFAAIAASANGIARCARRRRQYLQPG